MKKLILFLTSLLCVTGFAGCQFLTFNSSSSDSSPDSSVQDSIPEDSSSDSSSEAPIVKNKYTVTFTQYGQSDVVKTVEEGDTLTDIPTPADRTGYTVVWADVDLTNITENITVEAVETANTYTITYDAAGGEVTPATQEVTYDSAYTLATPTRENYDFIAWTYEGGAVSSAVWSIADDVTLVATWQEIIVNTYTVSFIQDGQATQTVTVSEGESVSEIPAVAEKTGYNVSWNLEGVDLTNISQNITVYATETPKEYTVTLNVGEGSLDVSTYVMTYDADYSLPAPTAKTGYEFVSWKKDDADFAKTGKWTFDEADVELVAVYKAKTYTIILDVNGGNELEQTSIQVTYGEALPELPTPTREASDSASYTFKGWKYGDTIIAAGSIWTIAEDNVTFVAEWQANNLWTSNY